MGKNIGKPSKSRRGAVQKPSEQIRIHGTRVQRSEAHLVNGDSRLVSNFDRDHTSERFLVLPTRRASYKGGEDHGFGPLGKCGDRLVFVAGIAVRCVRRNRSRTRLLGSAMSSRR